MGETLHDVGEDHLVDAEGYLLVQFRFGTSTEIGQIYRALAVRCIEEEVTRVLVKPGDADPAGERALRDAFTMVLLAGIAPGFRIAFVISAPAVEASYCICIRDLRVANIDAKLFSNEGEALSWLKPSGGMRRAA